MLLTFAFAAAACAKADPPDARRSAIIDGTLAPDDKATVLVLIQKLPDQELACTGAVVSPHVVATSAHCLDERVVGEGFTWFVFTGDDINDSAQADAPQHWSEVVEMQIDPDYDPAVLSAEHDIGVLRTKRKLSTTYPLREHALTADDVGKAISLIGYGRTDPDDGNSNGTRYRIDTRITALHPGDIQLTSEDERTGCSGDSGGPLLFGEGPEAQLIGLFSWGEHTTSCTGPNYATRIDTHTTFLRTQIDAIDPGFLPPPSAPPDMAPIDDKANGPDEGCNTTGTPLSMSPLALAILLARLRARRRRR